MCSRNLSIPSSTVILLLVLYSVDQASALRCFHCSSTSTGLCWKEPELTISQFCRPERSLTLNSTASSANKTIEAALAALDHENGVGTKYYPTFDCVKLVGRILGHDAVIRTCAVEQIPCSAYIATVEETGFKVSSCSRCSGDLCNSSSNIDAGITSLIVFAMLSFFQK